MKVTFMLEDHEDKVRVSLTFDPPLQETDTPTQALVLAHHMAKSLTELLGGQDTNPTN